MSCILRFAIFSIVFAWLSISHAQKALQSFPMTDGKVSAMHTSGDTLYFGGTFTRVFDRDSSSQHGAAVNPLTGGVLGKWDRPNGWVTKSIPDGMGGVYISGEFSRVGDSSRVGVAHLDSNGKVTSRIGRFGVNEGATAMAVRNDTLYLGGPFSGAGEMTKSGGAIITSAGNMAVGSPQVDGFVHAVISDGIGGWYVGGRFSVIGGQRRGNLARIDSAGNVYAWNPGVNGGTVYALVLNGTTLFVGGDFAGVGSSAARALAGVSTVTGSVTNTFPMPNAPVAALAVGGGRLFVGGNFTNFGAARRNAAAFNLSTGNLTSWNPDLNDDVQSLLVYGGAVYLGGSFTQVGGVTRNRLAAVDTVNGALLSFNPSSDSYCSALVARNDTLFVGGPFKTIGGQFREGLAAFNTGTGTILPWNAHIGGGNIWVSADIWVMGLALSGITLLVAGYFRKVDGLPRANLAGIDVVSGNAASWTPVVGRPAFAVAVSGNRVFAGGMKCGYGGEAATGVASVNTMTGVKTYWNPDPDVAISALDVSPNQQALFVGGAFAKMRGAPCPYLAKVDMDSGKVIAWLPFNPPNDNVTALACNGNALYLATGDISRAFRKYNIATAQLQWGGTMSGKIHEITFTDSNVFFAGNFSSISFCSNSYVAGFTPGGTALSFNPSGIGNVQGCAIIGNTLCAVGSIGTNIYSVKAFDLTTSALKWTLNSFAAQLGGNWIHDVSASGTNFYVGASDQFFGGCVRSNLASVVIGTGKMTSWNPGTNGEVLAITSRSNSVYLAGSFTMVGNQSRNRLAEVSALGSVASWNPGADAAVKALSMGNQVLYVGGDFLMVGGLTRQRLAAIDLSGAVTGWNPVANASVHTLLFTGGRLYAGGAFTVAGGQGRNRLVAFDTTTGATTAWNPGANADVHCLVPKGKMILAGGSFTTVSSQTRKGIVAIDHGGAVLSLNPQLLAFSGNPRVNAIAVNGSRGYVLGKFSAIGSQSRVNMGSFDLTTGQVGTWNPANDYGADVADPRSIAVRNTRVVVGGDFVLNGSAETVSNFAAFDEPGEFIFYGVSQVCNGVPFSTSVSMIPAAQAMNIFTVELSDASGSFLNPLTVGTGGSADSIMCVIPNYIPAGTGYRLRVVSSSPSLVTGSSPVTIHPMPVAGFRIPVPQWCQGGTYSVIDTSKISSGTLTRAWTFGDGGTGTLTPMNKIYADTGTHTITLVSMSSNGCSDTVSQTVSVIPRPTAGFAISTSAQCLTGNSFSVNDTSVFNSGTYTRLWTFGTGSADTSTLQSVGKSYTSAGTYSIRLRTYGSNGCKDSLTKTVTVRAKPVTGVISGPSSAFTGQTITFKVPKTSGSTYTWSVVAGTTVSANGTDSIRVAFPSIGTTVLKVVEQDVNGCSGDTLIKSVTVTVPDSLTLGTDTLKVPSTMGTQSVSLLSNRAWTVTNPAGWLSVTPGSGSGNSTLVANFTSNPLSTYRYANVSVTAGTVSRMLVVRQDFATGINDAGPPAAYRLWPNPSPGRITIEIPNVGQMQLLDATGRLIDMRGIGQISELDYGWLPAGVYFLTLNTGEATHHAKLLFVK